MGLVIWTGDINPDFQTLQETPGMVLKWGLAGAPYVTCDIGGFTGDTNALLLTRWYGVGAFMPIMRVHSTISAVPHFPFLWGDEAAAAMRDILNLRYRLVTYHYSNAHALYNNGTLVSRPLLFEYANDSIAGSPAMTSQWFDGPSIMAAPCLNEDNSSNIYIPAGDWYKLDTFTNTSATKVTGPTNISGTIALEDVPAYVKVGSIIPMAPVTQYTDQLPNGPLEVRVYGNVDATYTMIEDDGGNTDYESGNVKATTFIYSSATKTLSWTVSGSFTDSHVFTQVYGVLYDGTVQSTAPIAISTGSIKFQ